MDDILCCKLVKVTLALLMILTMLIPATTALAAGTPPSSINLRYRLNLCLF